MTTATTTDEQLAALEGLITHESGLLLQQLAARAPAGGVIVEIGSYKGKSACYLASRAATPVHCIEPWNTPGNIFGKHGFSEPSVEQTFRRQVHEMGYDDRIIVHKGFSHKVIQTFREPISLLYLDGSHKYEDVKRDFDLYYPLVIPGGIIVFDDFNTKPNPGVTKLVNYLQRRGDLVENWSFEVPPAAVCYKRLPRTDIVLSSAIMAHPKRERHMAYLQQKLPGTPIVWDQHNDRWDTGRRSMLAYDSSATHHVVVQDDALVCEDFLPGVAKSLAYVPPNNPVAYYTGRVRPSAQLVTLMVRKANALGSTWIAMTGPMWGVAVAVPTHLIDEMIEWCDKRDNIANYDLRMDKFFQYKGIECWYSLPSLVSHRTGLSEPSLVPGRGSGDTRIAHSFIGEDASALDVNWTIQPVRPRQL